MMNVCVAFSHVFCIAMGLTQPILNFFLHPQPIDLPTTVSSLFILFVLYYYSHSGFTNVLQSP